MNINVQPKLTTPKTYNLKNNYNNKYFDSNNYEEPLYLQKMPASPTFKGSQNNNVKVYDKFIEGIAKNYYGKLMQSGFIKWFGKKTEKLNVVNLCSAVNSLIISTMYVVMTLQNDNLNHERRNTLALNDAMTYVASTVLAYLVDNKLTKQWDKVTHNYAATQLEMTPEELTKQIEEANEKLFLKQIRVNEIKKANEKLPADVKVPVKQDIDILIQNADMSLDETAKNTLKNNVNNAITKANSRLSKNRQIALLDDKDLKKIVDKSYDVLNFTENQKDYKGLYDEVKAILSKLNEKLGDKKIPMTEDIEKAIQKANTILSSDAQIPTIEKIKNTLMKTNELLPNSSKITPEKLIANAEDYTRDVIKTRELNFKIKGMGIVKSLFIFGMIYRYVVPVLIMKPANKLGAKYNKRNRMRIEEQNKRIEMLKEFEAKEAAIKELEAKFKNLSEGSSPAAEASSKYLKLEPKSKNLSEDSSPTAEAPSKYLKLEPYSSNELANAS